MVWGPDYVELDEMKDYLRIAGDDVEDDAFLALWITAVSRNVDYFCGRQFGTVDESEQRWYTANWSPSVCRYVAHIDDLYDAAGLAVVDSSSNVISDFDLAPDNAPLKGRVYERVLLEVGGRIAMTTDKWGRASVPAAVKSGILLQGARLAARRDSPFGISGSPQEQGEIQLLARLDPDFITVLKPLRRGWWAS